MSESEFKRLGDYILDAVREAPQPIRTLPTGETTQLAEIESQVERRGVPARRMRDTFETFDLKRNPGMRGALTQCKKVAVGDAWCALLSGGYGNGKTHLAVATMHVFGWNRSYFWKVPDFLDWVRRTAFGDDGIPVETLLSGYMRGDFLLVLDDLGVENHTDWAGEQLYRVLDSRYDNELPTILTTNQPRERIDGRLLSRFSSGLVVCEGKDIRRQANQ